MKIKKEYTYTNKRQIWRLLPAADKLIIEDRNVETKEVFFNCIEINSGKKIFNNFQFDEKYWIGIETVENDIIFFHKFAKPDMPGHYSIIAFDINSQKIIWQNEEFVFLFIYDEKVYCFKQKFEGREFYSLDIKNGKKIEEFGDDIGTINSLKKKNIDKNNFKDYFFPEKISSKNPPKNIQTLIDKFNSENIIEGEIDYIELPELILLNFHSLQKNGTYNNLFYAVDIKSKKIILEEVLDTNIKSLIPDSFFVKDNLIFLIADKVKLILYLIKK